MQAILSGLTRGSGCTEILHRNVLNSVQQMTIACFGAYAFPHFRASSKPLTLEDVPGGTMSLETRRVVLFRGLVFNKICSTKLFDFTLHVYEAEIGQNLGLLSFE